MQNMDIRISARMAQIPLWQLAKQLNISEPTLYRHLREPLTDEERKSYFDALNQITTTRTINVHTAGR